MADAYDDAYVVLAGQALTITNPDFSVLRNDTDFIPELLAATTEGPSNGTLDLKDDGTFVYTPFAGFVGIDQFKYEVVDSEDQADEGTVSIHVVPVIVDQTTTLDLLQLTADEQVAATYVAFFGRGADREGFDFWVTHFNNSIGTVAPSELFSSISDLFGTSDEAKGLYPFLANPFGASDEDIGNFLNQVYDNLFNRLPDTLGLAFWTSVIKDTLAAGQFIGDVLISIIGGAQNSAAGQDITTLISKVAVGLHYVDSQVSAFEEFGGPPFTLEDDSAGAANLLAPVTDAPDTILTGIKNADALVEADLAEFLGP